MSAADAVAAWHPALAEVDALVIELAQALGKRNYARLPELTSHVMRCVLANPAKALSVLGPAFGSVDEIVMTMTTPAGREGVPAAAKLALVDLVNAYECMGAPLREICRKVTRAWLAELEPLDVHVGLAAYAIDDVPVAFRVMGLPLGARVDDPGARFTELGAVLPHFVAAIQASEDINAGLPTLRGILMKWGTHAVDEQTLLWIARLVFHDLGKQPLGSVAMSLHDMAQRLAREAAQAAPPPARSEFPLGATLASGAYRVDAMLRPGSYQMVCTGRRASDGAQVVISVDTATRHEPTALRAKIEASAPGLLELLFVGGFDGKAGPIAVVELVPDKATWLPSLAQPIATSRAVRLARSAGEILARASASGLVLTRARPDLMWTRGSDVVGLSTRAEMLFANKRADAVGEPPFDRYYFAPETYGTNAGDDRSLAFSLALMLAEWAQGRYPFKSLWYGNELVSGTHEPLALPTELASLLARALQRTPSQRPSLGELLAQLATFEM